MRLGIFASLAIIGLALAPGTGHAVVVTLQADESVTITMRNPSTQEIIYDGPILGELEVDLSLERDPVHGLVASYVHFLGPPSPSAGLSLLEEPGAVEGVSGGYIDAAPAATIFTGAGSSQVDLTGGSLTFQAGCIIFVPGIFEQCGVIPFRFDLFGDPLTTVSIDDPGDGTFGVTVTMAYLGAILRFTGTESLLTTACLDGLDNDGDGLVDFSEDTGCESAFDDSELSETPLGFHHSGNTDPSTSGWSLGMGAGTFAGPVTDPPDIDAWAIYDLTTGAGSILSYAKTPGPSDTAQGNQFGWELSTSLRVLPAEVIVMDPPDFSVGLEYNDGATRYNVFFGTRATLGAGSGDPIVGLYDGVSHASSPQVIVSGTGYHLYELVYDPVASTATLYVDGVARLSDYAGHPAGSVPARFYFGSGSSATTGRAHYAEVSWAPNAPNACGDGIDNDGDGDIDLVDAGCLTPGALTETPDCSDGIDNDGDGLIDFDGAEVTAADPGCSGPGGSSEVPPSACGLGPDLALILPLLLGLHGRRKRTSK